MYGVLTWLYNVAIWYEDGACKADESYHDFENNFSYEQLFTL